MIFQGFIIFITIIQVILCNCPTQTYEVSLQNATCEPCYKPYNGCLTCPDNSDCYVCMDGWYHVSRAVNHCTPCTQQWGKCNQCSEQSCIRCDFNYGPHSVGICLQCDTNCLRCTYIQGYQCYECEEGMTYDPDTKQCRSCQNNECCYEGQQNCEKCTTGSGLNENYICQPNCTLSDVNCEQCRFNSINQPYCYDCKDTFYLDNLGICQSCTTLNCSSCSSSTCNKCKEGYFLQGGQCIKCSDNCYDCLSSTQCYLCLPGYYTDSSFQCQDCTIPRCLHCSDNTECMECEEGYYLKDRDFTCHACPLQCKHCRQPENEDDTPQCVTCKESFILTTQYQCIMETDAQDGDQALDGSNILVIVKDDQNFNNVIIFELSVLLFIIISILI